MIDFSMARYIGQGLLNKPEDHCLNKVIHFTCLTDNLEGDIYTCKILSFIAQIMQGRDQTKIIKLGWTQIMNQTVEILIHLATEIL